MRRCGDVSQIELGRSRRSGHRRGQGGELLLETLVSIVIMSTVIIGGLFFAAAFTTASALQRQRVTTTNEVAVAAEAVERLVYRPCTASANKAAHVNALAADFALEYVPPNGYTSTLTVTDVAYVNAGSSVTWRSDCEVSGVKRDNGAQRVTVKVTNNSTGVNNDVTFTKRDNRCPASAVRAEGQGC